MNLILPSFTKIPHKIFSIISEKWESFYYRFYYSRPELDTDFIRKRYLFYGGDDFREVPKNYSELFPDNVQDKIIQADLICNHIFDLLGSGPTKLSPEGEGYQPINWHIDFKSNYSWNPKIFFHNIRFGHIEGVDIKVPWELSRFQHLNILGEAYVLTGDMKYAEEFKNQITDWIMNNRVGFGVNWKCTMDVAIRASNWLVSQEYFSGKDVFPKEFWQEFYSSIYEHGRFIIKHLENRRGLTNNHYISDLAGLFFIVVYCPFFKESKSWQQFALTELSKEIEKQVYPDGCNFEASTSYHCLLLELFFYAKLLGERAGIEFPISYEDRIRKMFEFSLYCIKPNGMVPQIGDNDSGRFLIFHKKPILEHKYLLSLAAVYYRDSQFKLSSFTFDQEAFWIFGKTGKQVYDDLPFRRVPVSSKSFPDAGWYIMRHNDDYCFITCGVNGQNENGGHAHNDKLSFELMLSNQDIVVDPGTYVYTAYPKERNKFRSTKYHNTVSFNGYEQNEICEKDLFRLLGRVTIQGVTFKETDNNIVFQGEIEYACVKHKRKISLDKESGNCQIHDRFSCSRARDAKVIFHLSPNLTSEDNEIFMERTKDKVASIEIQGNRFKKDEYDYSPEYGVKMKAEYLVASIFATQDIKTINTYIYKA